MECKSCPLGVLTVATSELVQGGPKASRGHHVAQAWLPLQVCFPDPHSSRPIVASALQVGKLGFESRLYCLSAM